MNSRLMTQAGSYPCPLEGRPSKEVVELQEQLQQSSSALRSSQQQLQALSARVEELEASLEAEVARMMMSVEEELHAIHDRHHAEMRNAQERLQREAEEAAAAAAEQEASLREALRVAEQAAQYAESIAEAERASCRQLTQRLEAYDEIWLQLQSHLLSTDDSRDIDDNQVQAGDPATAWQGPHVPSNQAPAGPKALLIAACTLQARLIGQAARGAATAENVAAAAAASAADAAAWRARVLHAEEDAIAACLAADELQQSLGVSLVALHEEVLALSATNADVTVELEQRQAQVAELTASGVEQDSRVVRMSAKISSLDKLQNALQRELMDTGARHAALEAQVAELQDELLTAQRRNSELAAELSELQDKLQQVLSCKHTLVNKVSQLQGKLDMVRACTAALEVQVLEFDSELRSALSREEAQRLMQDEERLKWHVLQKQDREAEARLVTAVIKLLVAAGLEDEQSRSCSSITVAALEDLLCAAANFFADTRRVAALQLKNLENQVADLCERLGQSKARSRLEDERHEGTLSAERNAGCAALTAPCEHATKLAASALCMRAFRAVERTAAATMAADAEAAQTAAQQYAVQQSARAICLSVVRRQEACEASTAAAAAAAQLVYAKEQHASTLAMLTVARHEEQMTAIARTQALEDQLSDSYRERDDLTVLLGMLQDSFEKGRVREAHLAAQLEGSLAAGTAASEAAGNAHERMMAAKTTVAHVQAELAAMQRERDESNEALHEALAAKTASQVEVASALGKAKTLQQEVTATAMQRQQLQEELVMTGRAAAELRDCLAAASATVADLQSQLIAYQCKRDVVAARLDKSASALLEQKEQATVAESTSAGLQLDLAAITTMLDTMVEINQEHGAEAKAERLHLAHSLAAAEQHAVELQYLLAAAVRQLDELVARLPTVEEGLTEQHAHVVSIDASHVEMQVTLEADCEALLQQQIQQQRTAEAEKWEIVRALAAADFAREAAIQHCAQTAQDLHFALKRSQSDGEDVHMELKCLILKLQVACSGLDEAHADLELERIAHAATRARAESQQAACASLQDELRKLHDELQQERMAFGIATGAVSHQFSPPLWCNLANPTGASEAHAAGDFARAKQLRVLPLESNFGHALIAEAVERLGMDLRGGRAVLRDSSDDAAFNAPEVHTSCSSIASASRCRTDWLQYNELVGDSLKAQETCCPHISGSVSPIDSLSEAPEARANHELKLHQQLSSLQVQLEAEREAHAVRLLTLRAFRSAERNELQRQLKILASTAELATAMYGSGYSDGSSMELSLRASMPIGFPRVPIIGHNDSAGSVKVDASSGGTMSPVTSGPCLGGGFATGPLSVAEDAASTQMWLRCAGTPSRGGLAPVPLLSDSLQLPTDWELHHHEQQQYHHNRQSLGGISSLNSISSTGNCYWLPASKMEAADYDPYHQSMWMANPVFGGAVSSGCLSSAAPSEAHAADMADIIVALDADLAATQATQRMECSDAEGQGCGERHGAAGVETLGLGCSNCVVGYGGLRATEATVVGVEGSPPAAVNDTCAHQHSSIARESLKGHMAIDESDTVSTLLHGFEMERGNHLVRQMVLRTLRAVECSALKQELADARDAFAPMTAAAEDMRARLSALLAVHARVCGELEVLRAERAELAAEMMPTRRVVEGLRAQISQLRTEVCKEVAWRDAATGAATNAAADAVKRLAGSESRAAALNVLCKELAARYEEMEAQVQLAISPRLPQSCIVEATEVEAEATPSHFATGIWEPRSKRGMLGLALESQYTTTRVTANVLGVEAPEAVVAKPAEVSKSVRRRSLPLETIGMTVASGLVRGSAVLSGNGGYGMVRRCPSAVDLYSLAHRVQEAAEVAELDTVQVATMQPQPLQQASPEHDGVSFMLGGLSIPPMCGDSSGSTSSCVMPGSFSMRMQHLALLQDCGAWNDWTSGPTGAHMRKLAGRQRCGSSTGGSALFLATTAATARAGHEPESAAAAAAAAASLTAFGVSAAACMATSATCRVPHESSAPTSTIKCVAHDSIEVGIVPRQPTALDQMASLHRGLLRGGLLASAGQRPSGGHVAAVASPAPCLKRPSPSSLPLQQQDSVCHGDKSAAPEPESSPEFAPCAYVRQTSHLGAGTSALSAQQQTTRVGKLRRLDEEHEDEQDDHDAVRQQIKAGCARDGSTGEQGEIADDGMAEQDAYGALEESSDDSGVCESFGDLRSGFRMSLPRTASETDIHLFYNPVFTIREKTASFGGKSTGPAPPARRSRQVTPYPAHKPLAEAALSMYTDPLALTQSRHPEAQERTVTPARALAIDSQAHPTAAGHVFTTQLVATIASSMASGYGINGSQSRGMSSDDRDSEEAQVQRFSLHPSVSGSVSGSGNIGSAGGSGSSSGENVFPATRPNPVTKLCKKISRRLGSSTSR